MPFGEARRVRFTPHGRSVWRNEINRGRGSSAFGAKVYHDDQAWWNTKGAGRLTRAEVEVLKFAAIGDDPGTTEFPVGDDPAWVGQFSIPFLVGVVDRNVFAEFPELRKGHTDAEDVIEGLVEKGLLEMED